MLEGLGAGDTITVDYSGGNPVPAAGLVIDGGSGAGDVLSVVGSAGNDAVTLASGGSIEEQSPSPHASIRKRVAAGFERERHR